MTGEWEDRTLYSATQQRTPVPLIYPALCRDQRICRSTGIWRRPSQ